MRIAVSFLRKDVNEMTAESIIDKLPKLKAAGVDTVQWDLMDGKYNNNNTVKYFPPETMKRVMDSTTLGSEAHMMVIEPWNFIDNIKDCCSMFIFHIEACASRSDVMKTIDKIKSFPGKVGIAIEPDTPVAALDEYIHLLDLVLVMTVRTGFAGQSFIDMSDKIKKLVEIRTKRGLDYEIEVDGGVNGKTIDIVRAAGCNAVNSASYILDNDYNESVKTLKGK